MAFVNNDVSKKDIVGETISYETIHEFGLTELLNVYKQSKERYPTDYSPYVAVFEGEWVWGNRDYKWFKDKNSSNWIYMITGFRTYLLCCDGVLYEARVDEEREGDIRGGDVAKYFFKFKSIQALAPKDEWQTEPTKAPTNKYWESFILKGSKFYGDIPYAKDMLEAKKTEEVKSCLKKLLYGAMMIKLGRIVEHKRERVGKDFNTDIIIEMNW